MMDPDTMYRVLRAYRRKDPSICERELPLALAYIHAQRRLVEDSLLGFVGGEFQLTESGEKLYQLLHAEHVKSKLLR